MYAGFLQEPMPIVWRSWLVSLLRGFELGAPLPGSMAVRRRETQDKPGLHLPPQLRHAVHGMPLQANRSSTLINCLRLLESKYFIGLQH